MTSTSAISATSAVSDAVSQVQQIESQLQQLSSGALMDSVLGLDATGTTSSSSDTSSDTTSFADALAAIEDGGSAATTDAANATASTTSANAVYASDHSGSSTNVTLPSAASSLLTSDQQTFAKELAAKTGLSPAVVCSWLLAEESGSAAQSRQSEGNNDWLNIGYTDSATYGASDSIWSSPTSAADATAAWLEGKDSIPGYGTASSGVQSILDSVGQSTAAQISALQSSGWASSGYPSLNQIYSEVTGS